MKHLNLNDARGFTLMEMNIVVALIILVATFSCYMVLQNSFDDSLGTAYRIRALLLETRAIAENSATFDQSGSTIIFDFEPGQNSITAKLFRFRPERDKITVPLTPVDTYTGIAKNSSISLKGVALKPPFSIFLGSTGSVSAAAINAEKSGVLVAEPAINCTNGKLIFEVQSLRRTRSIAINCDTGFASIQ